MKDRIGSMWAVDGELWMQARRLYLQQWYYPATVMVSSWVKWWKQYWGRGIQRGERRKQRRGNQPEGLRSQWGISWIGSSVWGMVAVDRKRKGACCSLTLLFHSKEDLKKVFRNLWNTAVIQKSAWGRMQKWTKVSEIAPRPLHSWHGGDPTHLQRNSIREQICLFQGYDSAPLAECKSEF